MYTPTYIKKHETYINTTQKHINKNIKQRKQQKYKQNKQYFCKDTLSGANKVITLTHLYINVYIIKSISIHQYINTVKLSGKTSLCVILPQNVIIIVGCSATGKFVLLVFVFYSFFLCRCLLFFFCFCF